MLGTVTTVDSPSVYQFQRNIITVLNIISSRKIKKGLQMRTVMNTSKQCIQEERLARQRQRPTIDRRE